MRNNLYLISKFWMMWIFHKNNQGKWRDLTKFFDKSENFEESLNKIEHFLFFNTSTIFEQSKAEDNLDFCDKNAKIIEEKIRERNIEVILFDQFKDFNSLKKIKHAYWFFIKGDVDLLNLSQDNFVSVVGSRKTPQNKRKWVENSVPKNKVIVSGLATGADVMGHKVAMENNQKIIIFPGLDIYEKPKNTIKKEIFDYGVQNGLILTDIFPGSKFYDSSNFLKRNKWMAQMVCETYVVYFKGLSGTLGQVLEVARMGGKIITSKSVFEDNLKFLKEHKSFNEILKGKYNVT